MLLDMQRSLATSEIHGNCFFIHWLVILVVIIKDL
jgi:hypothetical protein